MGKNIRSALQCVLTACCLLFFLPACVKDNVSKTGKGTKTITLQRPIFENKTTVLADINGSPSEAIDSAGKIYIKGNFIFLNEVDKGIHIIDNSNPLHPEQTAFLNIPGNQDIAVKGNILYADMYSDLLAIDISDPHHANITNRISNLFTSRQYVGSYYSDSSQVIVGWITKDTVVSEDYMTYPYWSDCNGCMFMSASSAKSSAPGVAGSMAKMVLIKNYIFAITEPHSLGVVNVSNATTPFLESDLFAGYDLETIYPFQDKLFLGSAVGMFMFDISNPVSPVSLGQFEHGRACDPVVTDGNYAYVTLRAGSNCGGSSNELDVINVQNLKQPDLVKAYPMAGPTGLCKDGSLLFVCDGSDGVKVYDASSPSDLKLLQKIESKEPYDVIASDNHAFVIAKDGLYQYDYSDIQHVRQLSSFFIKR